MADEHGCQGTSGHASWRLEKDIGAAKKNIVPDQKKSVRRASDSSDSCRPTIESLASFDT